MHNNYSTVMTRLMVTSWVSNCAMKRTEQTLFQAPKHCRSKMYVGVSGSYANSTMYRSQYDKSHRCMAQTLFRALAWCRSKTYSSSSINKPHPCYWLTAAQWFTSMLITVTSCTPVFQHCINRALGHGRMTHQWPIRHGLEHTPKVILRRLSHRGHEK